MFYGICRPAGGEEPARHALKCCWRATQQRQPIGSARRSSASNGNSARACARLQPASGESFVRFSLLISLSPTSDFAGFTPSLILALRENPNADHPMWPLKRRVGVGWCASNFNLPRNQPSQWMQQCKQQKGRGSLFVVVEQ